MEEVENRLISVVGRIAELRGRLSGLNDQGARLEIRYLLAVIRELLRMMEEDFKSGNALRHPISNGKKPCGRDKD
jgi:hypothetical protein